MIYLFQVRQIRDRHNLQELRLHDVSKKICTIYCSTCFLGWIRTTQILHSTSERQARI